MKHQRDISIKRVILVTALLLSSVGQVHAIGRISRATSLAYKRARWIGTRPMCTQQQKERRKVMAQIDMTEVVSPIVDKMEETIDKLDDASAHLDTSIKSVENNIGKVRCIQTRTLGTQHKIKELSEKKILPGIDSFSKRLTKFNKDVKNVNAIIKKNTHDLKANWTALQDERRKEEVDRNKRWKQVKIDSEIQWLMSTIGIFLGVVGLCTGMLTAARSSKENKKATEAIRVLNKELNESKEKMDTQMSCQLEKYQRYTQDLSTTVSATIKEVHQLNSELNERKEKDIQLKEEIEQLPSYIVKGTAASSAIIIIASFFLNR